MIMVDVLRLGGPAYGTNATLLEDVPRHGRRIHSIPALELKIATSAMVLEDVFANDDRMTGAAIVSESVLLRTVTDE
jgi:hypothetical protein